MNKTEYPLLGEAVYAHTLPCGLEIRVIPKQGFAKTYAFLAANYGSVDMTFRDGDELVQAPAGVAHYLEHKMFDLPEGNAMQQFAATGASPNAFTSYAMTAYYFDCTDRFEENLRLLLHFVTTPYFTQESVEKERSIIAQEIRMYEDSAGSACFEQLAQAMYAHHPLRVPIAGTVESIQAITPELLYRCHASFYDPANLMLCVVGDVSPQRICDLAAALMPQHTRPVPQKDYGAPEALTPVHSKLSRRMEIAMPAFSAGFKARPTARGIDAFRAEIAGELAAEMLAGEGSALYGKLYDAGLIDADFSTGYESLRGAAFLNADGDSRDPDAVRQALLDEADRLLRQGLDQAEFDRLKKSALGRRLRDLDSFESICYRTCAYHFEGCDYFSFPGIYASIQLQDVADFLRDTVQPERAALSVILPKETEGRV